jgi:hypothetical protein
VNPRLHGRAFLAQSLDRLADSVALSWASNAAWQSFHIDWLTGEVEPVSWDGYLGLLSLSANVDVAHLYSNARVYAEA